MSSLLSLSSSHLLCSSVSFSPSSRTATATAASPSLKGVVQGEFPSMGGSASTTGPFPSRKPPAIERSPQASPSLTTICGGGAVISGIAPSQLTATALPSSYMHEAVYLCIPPSHGLNPFRRTETPRHRRLWLDSARSSGTLLPPPSTCKAESSGFDGFSISISIHITGVAPLMSPFSGDHLYFSCSLDVGCRLKQKNFEA
ncbi:uncharacterized protein LOC104429919 isoform X1 [Eucalyptus grandis]|uniref:uncharacterized protein LOC104429919 isoform X1 n=1 Tax=Eucalyptus grandis TaxID=71139 RepID=UPI00192F01A7|nr:uncharacterized protein LOC104429919 isoform X1 [Eucalyptus grandis]